MKTQVTWLQVAARRTFICVSFIAMVVGIGGVGVGCISPELLARAERVELFESEAAPQGYLLIGQVYAAERFPGLRPIEQQVIDKLKLRAAKLGADAIGNVYISRSSRVRFAGTPRFIELRGSANYYRKRPTN